MGSSTLGSTADLIDGTNTGTVKSMSMQWRERAAAEIAAGLASDVFNLSGMTNTGSQTDQFTLRMSYSPGQLSAGDVAELFSYNGANWVNAVLGNIGGTAQFMGVSSPDGILGHYGIDPGAGNTVWAVLTTTASSPWAVSCPNRERSPCWPSARWACSFSPGGNDGKPEKAAVIPRRTDFLIRPWKTDGLGNPSYEFPLEAGRIGKSILRVLSGNWTD